MNTATRGLDTYRVCSQLCRPCPGKPFPVPIDKSQTLLTWRCASTLHICSVFLPLPSFVPFVYPGPVRQLRLVLPAHTRLVYLSYLSLLVRTHGDISSTSGIGDVSDHIPSSSRQTFMTGHAIMGIRENFFWRREDWKSLLPSILIAHPSLAERFCFFSTAASFDFSDTCLYS